MKSFDTIIEHWEIRFRDIDPDSGKVSQDIPLAITTVEDYAEMIKAALSAADNDSPNREYYVLHRLTQNI